MENVEKYYERAVELYKTLHQHAELEFDLPETIGIVKKELDAYKIEYTEKYGKGSIVAEIGKGEKIIALRSDMDALPIEENSGFTFSSKNKGCMHACGHDSHTAILLSVARYLKENEDKLNVKVRLIFQPSEEGIKSGAEMMVANGVMEGVDHIVCTHSKNELVVGKIGVCYGDYMAACTAVTIRFSGKPSHAALPKFGINANDMGSEAYILIKSAVKELANGKPYIWNVGSIVGGHASNIVSGEYTMKISFRYYDMGFATDVNQKVNEICKEVATRYGGKYEMVWISSTIPVHNDEKITEIFETTLKTAGIPVETIPSEMISEDFAHYLTKAPGMLFRFGTRNEEKGCTAAAHCNDFRIDESGMKPAIQAFCDYVMNMA